MEDQNNIVTTQGPGMGENPQLKDERNWAMFCHLGGLSIFLGIPFGNIVVPLIIWLIKRKEMPLVDTNGKEALNFQISMTIYLFLAGMLCFVFIGFLLVFPLIIADLVFVILASVKTSSGEKYEYPLAIKFLQ